MATPVGGIDDTLDNGIIGYWSFDGDYLDSSGNGNDFTKVGNPILIPDKDGEADHAYGSLYNGGYFTQSSPIGSVDIFGFSLWIYVPTAGGTSYKDYGGFYDTSAGLLIERTLSDNLTYIGKVGGNVTPTLSEGWHNIIINHPAVSPDIHVYVDGIIETTGGSAQVGTGFTYFRIGAGVFDATPCSIDEIRLNDRIFTASEIAEIQTMGVNYSGVVDMTINTTSTVTSIQCSWDAVALADTYTVRYRKGVEAFTEVTGITTNSYNIIGLEVGTLYDIEVDAIDINPTIIGQGTTTETTLAILVDSVVLTRNKDMISIMPTLNAIGYTVDKVVKWKQSTDSVYRELPIQTIENGKPILIYGINVNSSIDIIIET